MNPQSPGPGWWLASDGRWYPPQQAQQPQQPQRPAWGPPPQGPPQYTPQYAPQPAPKTGRNRGCIIAAVVVLVIVLAGGGIAVYFIVSAAHKIGDLASNGGAGIVSSSTESCIPAAEVSSIVGSAVRDPIGGTLVGTSGCAYLATDQTAGADVNIIVAPDLVADDQFKDFTDEASSAQVTPQPVPVGDKGLAYASGVKSAAIAKGGGKVALVEIMSAAGNPIGDKKNAAVQLLQRAFK